MGPSSKVPSRMRARTLVKSFLASVSALALSLLLAAPALAAKGGEGLYGKTNDKVVTNFGYGLMIFFTLLVTVLSLGQWLLERRKQSK
jgi:hypothetical protein